ncbi:MAG: hypothetical protein KatS3mg043_1410 [Rhodothermaceae bacterium]|nr:MAG: hypothetical protein KatS3mg043_1410 [Rhodothermaceae bacterium]
MHLEGAAQQVSGWRFAQSFTIGRDPSCDVHLDSGLVSRVHAEVALEDGRWWIRDLDSTNGLYVDGRKTRRAPLEGEAVVQLGRNAPVLRLTVEEDPARRETGPAAAAGTAHREAGVPTLLPETGPTGFGRTIRAVSGTSLPDATPSSPPPDSSLSKIIARYFDEAAAGPAGERTRLIRQAYATVKQKQRRQYARLLGGVLVILLVVAGYAIFQAIENRRLERRAAELFMEMRELDLTIAKLRQVAEAEGNAALEEQLEAIQTQRERMAARYDGYVREFGVYRRLRDEDRLIYKTARIFNESEFALPAGFVREVKATIRNYWLGPGRPRFVEAVRRAEENGYTRLIVETMTRYGLPPEFFYLALQESDFIADRIGPPTRWGRAKGMWQFIPSTARLYGLDVGERTDLAWADPQDERLDPVKATDAAARYLRYIYSTAAQASGLLVMASYNWGEHRVIGKLEDLPNAHAVLDVAFADIPEDPHARTYWRFLTEYADRMPEETKDYVLKIFAAAVIGQDPRHFGFDFDNPLLPYMDRPEDQPAPSTG